jgi:hypothetical protein
VAGVDSSSAPALPPMRFRVPSSLRLWLRSRHKADLPPPGVTPKHQRYGARSRWVTREGRQDQNGKAAEARHLREWRDKPGETGAFTYSAFSTRSSAWSARLICQRRTARSQAAGQLSAYTWPSSSPRRYTAQRICLRPERRGRVIRRRDAAREGEEVPYGRSCCGGPTSRRQSPPHSLVACLIASRISSSGVFNRPSQITGTRRSPEVEEPEPSQIPLRGCVPTSGSLLCRGLVALLAPALPLRPAAAHWMQPPFANRRRI